MSRSEVIGCRGHHGRPSILLPFRNPDSPAAPVLCTLTMPANALTQPVARKQLAALQAPTLLALVLVLAFRLWLQFAHASRKRLSKQFHPERVVAYPQRRHFTFRTWPLPPRSELLNPAVISGGIVGCRDSNTIPRSSYRFILRHSQGGTNCMAQMPLLAFLATFSCGTYFSE